MKMDKKTKEQLINILDTVNSIKIDFKHTPNYNELDHRDDAISELAKAIEVLTTHILGCKITRGNPIIDQKMLDNLKPEIELDEIAHNRSEDHEDNLWK